MARCALRVGAGLLRGFALAAALLALTAGTASAAAPFRATAPPVVVVSGSAPSIALVLAAPRKAAKSVVVRIVFSPTTRAAAGVAIGTKTVRNVKARKSRAVRVATIIPAEAPWTVGYLIGCVKIGKAKEKCATVHKVGVSPTAASSAKIAAARAARILTATRALHLLADSLRGRALPAPYRNGKGVSDEGADGRFIAMWQGASAADRRFMVPYMLPPDTRGSAWALKTKPRVQRAARASSRAEADPCATHAAIDAQGWATESAAGGAVLFDFDHTTDLGDVLSLTAAMDTKIYTLLTKPFRVPLSDAAETCAHGGTGALDVYVSHDWTGGGGAMTSSYPLTAADPCLAKAHPVFILLNPSVGGVGLAHEFFHAVQAAYAYPKWCATSDFTWIDEATAVWAEYLAYPGNAFTRVQRKLHPVQKMAGLTEQYRSWLFWYATAKLHGGPKVINDAMGALESSHATTLKSGVSAIDGALPGGLRLRLEDYAAIAWNHAPVGTSGFPISDTYAKWGIDPERPARPAAPLELKLAPLHVKTVKLDAGAKADGNVFGMAFGRRRYADLTIKDPKAKELQWKNGFIGRPGVDVQAYLHLADGTWRQEDWSKRATVTLCRTHASENVDRILIATTNADIATLRSLPDGVVDEMRLRDICSFPKLYRGTWTRVITDPTRGSWTETIHGTATFRRNPVLPPIAEEIIQVPYDFVSGSVTWSVSGYFDDPISGCTAAYSGSGTDAIVPQDTLSNTKMGVEDVSPRPTAPQPEPEPYYYAIAAEGDPFNAPKYTVVHGGNCSTTPPSMESIVQVYLDIGVFGDFTGLAPDRIPFIQKSANLTLLAGHSTLVDPSFSTFGFDDTWSFVGTDG